MVSYSLQKCGTPTNKHNFVKTISLTIMHLLFISCGNCFSERSCSCISGEWVCTFTDACLRSSCVFTTLFTDLLGKTCAEARTGIFETYPGMTVVCLTEPDLGPTDDDFNRYIVNMDDSGSVTSVVMGSNSPCPETFTSTCGSTGQKCTWIEPPTGNLSETTKTCTCLAGEWSFCEGSVSILP